MAFRTTAHVLLTAALLASSGCSFLRAATGIGFERPTLTFESWAPDQLDLDGVTIALHYRIDNPNGFGIDLQRLDYRLDVEEQQVAEGRLPMGLQVQPRGATAVTFPIRLRWRDIPNLVELLVTRSDLAYRVSGTAGVGSELGRVDLPFEHHDRLAVPRPVLRFGTGGGG